MTRLPLLALGLACALAPACLVPAPVAPAPAAPGPIEVVVRLDPADRGLLERLLAERALAAPVAREPLPAQVPLHRAAPAEPHRRRPEGPVLQASYNSGAPLYEGRQVVVGEDWERHGPWHAWHPNGQVWEEGAYFQGKEHGPWRWWYENGSLQAVGTFDHGQHVGPWVFYFENGREMAAGSYVADRPVGTWTTHDESGALVSEGSFEQGLRTGPWTFYSAPGVVDRERSGRYEAGERVGD